MAERLVVAFAARLRRAGLDVPPGAVVSFAQALDAVGLSDRQGVYWAGRATLLRRPEDRDVYDRVFAEFFENRPALTVLPAARPVTLAVDEPEDDVSPGPDPDPAPEDEAGETLQVRYSALEVLRHEDFARYGVDEWDEARRLIAELRSRSESRPSRRLKPARSGSTLDLPRTVRAALSSDGEALRRAWRREAARPRRLVFLVDVSGSMEPYARAFLRFAQAAVVSRPAGAAEVFVLGTRVTRITRPLSSRDPDAALAEAGRLVEDWYGGTRLGEGLRTFNERWGARGMARGAVVVILSDGWDRGDPEQLGDEMARLRRVSHRIVWVNPLRASPGYEPIARGMSAALPYVDDFVDGHSIASLEELVGVLAASPGR
jgi:uncharacterized protein with von Willebrand factor type A (vWA) domain